MRRGKGEIEAAGERRESLTWVSPHQMETQSRLQLDIKCPGSSVSTEGVSLLKQIEIKRNKIYASSAKY